MLHCGQLKNTILLFFFHSHDLFVAKSKIKMKNVCICWTELFLYVYFDIHQQINTFYIILIFHKFSRIKWNNRFYYFPIYLNYDGVFYVSLNCNIRAFYFTVSLVHSFMRNICIYILLFLLTLRLKCYNWK